MMHVALRFLAFGVAFSVRRISLAIRDSAGKFVGVQAAAENHDFRLLLQLGLKLRGLLLIGKQFEGPVGVVHREHGSSSRCSSRPARPAGRTRWRGRTSAADGSVPDWDDGDGEIQVGGSRRFALWCPSMSDWPGSTDSGMGTCRSSRDSSGLSRRTICSHEGIGWSADSAPLAWSVELVAGNPRAPSFAVRRAVRLSGRRCAEYRRHPRNR